jgi:DNA-binding NtrC family response regulator
MADVVLVDDDEDVVWALGQILEDDGHAVRIGRNGEEGLALLRQRLPELVVLDVEMPRLCGPDMAYRMFVHNCGLENIPIILVSGVFELPKVAARVGTPYFLSKPFDVSKLLGLVARALSEQALPRPSV